MRVSGSEMYLNLVVLNQDFSRTIERRWGNKEAQMPIPFSREITF